MSNSSADRNPVERLAEEFAQRYRRGERPALSEYVEKYPQHADEIRELFPALVLMEQLKPDTENHTVAYSGSGSEARPPLERLGDYHILREVGRGGMGVVYEAEQVSLGRHVALKVLPPHALLNSTFLERFRREARAAAKLHHTNIVPVFGVGESEGIHYYAMQFIQGESLDRVLHDLRRFRQVSGGTKEDGHEGTIAHSLLAGQFTAVRQPFQADSFGHKPEAQARETVLSPSLALRACEEESQAGKPDVQSALSKGSESGYFRSVARVGLQVAEALAYAHRQGVLHRDIKPSNLLLDRQGTVWITDFGLAKAEGSDELTHTGDIVGTLRFMAPERFDGHSLPHSDVYSLGLTLYELLTLRPAFEDSNKARLIDRILHEPPASLRKWEPHVPRDLETVVLKCLAKESAERYASAETLADDLQRFLADRPIKARRTPWYERTWRWCRRNPVVSTLTAVVLLLLTVTAVGGVVMSVRLNDALGVAQQAERDGKRKLFESLMSEADAMRRTGQAGQRFGTLQRIREALEIGREIGVGDKDRIRLRNIAIAALCLPDVEAGQEWPAGPDQPVPEQVDPLIRRQVEARYTYTRLPKPAFWLGDFAASPDGRFLAVATEGWSALHTPAMSVRLWRVDGAKPVLVLEVPGKIAGWNPVAFRPDSRQVAFAHNNGTVSIYDPQTGRLVRRLVHGTGGTAPLAYHPRLPWLAISSGSTVSIQDVSTGKRLSLLSHPQEVLSVAWHPRGHRLVCASGRHVYLWDAATGQPVTEPWVGHRTGGIHLTFNHGGDRIFSNDWGRILRMWDAATGRLLLSWPASGVSPFGSDDQSFGPIDVGTDKWRQDRVTGGREMRTFHRPTPRGSERLINFSLHPNGRLLAASTRSGLCFFDLLTGEEIGFVAGDISRDVGFAAGNYSRNLSFDRTGSLWTTGSAGLMRWPVSPVAGDTHRLRIGPPGWVADLLLGGHDGFSASADGRVAAVPLYTQGALLVHRGPPRRTLRLGPQFDARWVFVSPDGRWVVTGSHGLDDSGVRYKVWEAGTGRLVANLPYADVTEFHGFSPDSRWLYVSGKENRRLDVASLSRTVPLPTPVAPRTGSLWRQEWQSERTRVGGTFSPDSRLAAFGRDDGSISLVLTEKDEEIARLYSPEVGRIFPSSFSSDGTLLLAVGEESGALYVFDLRRIRTGLADLGLDWDAPLYPSAREQETNPALAPSLHVELIGAERAASAAAAARAGTEQAINDLFFNPFDPEAHCRLGMRLLVAGRFVQAHAHLGTALAFRSDLDEALYPHALAAFQLKRYDEALRNTTRCLDKWPHHHGARYLRTRTNRMLKRYNEAVADATAWIAVYPARPQGYELRALCYHALGKADLAKVDRARAIQFGGRNPSKN